MLLAVRDSKLFAHIRMIYRKAKLKETLLEEYKKYVVPAGTNAADFIDNVMQPYADAYEVIKTGTYQSLTSAVNQLLGWLNLLTGCHPQSYSCHGT